jgi:hypothetical protein
MHCKCTAEIRSPIIDQRILYVLDIICKKQCLTTAIRSFVNGKSFYHISASVLVNFYVRILQLKTFTCNYNLSPEGVMLRFTISESELVSGALW